MTTWRILAARETGIQNLEQGWTVWGSKQSRRLDGKKGAALGRWLQWEEHAVFLSAPILSYLGVIRQLALQRASLASSGDPISFLCDLQNKTKRNDESQAKLKTLTEVAFLEGWEPGRCRIFSHHHLWPGGAWTERWAPLPSCPPFYHPTFLTSRLPTPSSAGCIVWGFASETPNSAKH